MHSPSREAHTFRSIRVFVSSTFRDMHDEREELIKRVFPRLRRLCEARGVAWSEVDLRWGVTDEQKAEGAVLPICLAEIDRSRPYFIGLLGQRYGWIPKEVPQELADRVLWLAALSGTSVTEYRDLSSRRGRRCAHARCRRSPRLCDGANDRSGPPARAGPSTRRVRGRQRGTARARG